MGAPKQQLLAAVISQGLPTFVIRPGRIPPGGTFSRGTSATQVNADGSLTLVPAGVLRTADYSDDPARAGIKIEGQATNLIRNSVGSGSVVGGSATSATYWSSNGQGAQWSINGKGDNYIDFLLSGTVSGSNPFIDFELTNHITTTPGSVSSFAVSVALISGEPISFDAFLRYGSSTNAYVGEALSRFNLTPGAAVFRAKVSGASVAQAAFVTPRFRVVASAGQTLNHVFRLSMPQLETGPVATSYIPTAGAAVTRGADVWTYPVGAIAGWNSSAGSFTSSIRCGPISARNGGILSVALASGNAELYFNFGKQSLYNGVNTTDLQPVSDADVVNGIKSAIAYAAAGGLQAIKGGVSGATLSPLIAGQQPASVSIGSMTGSSLGGSLYALDYYPVALPAARLQQLTAP